MFAVCEGKEDISVHEISAPSCIVILYCCSPQRMSAFTKVTKEFEEIEAKLKVFEGDDEKAKGDIEAEFKALSGAEKRLNELKTTQVDKFVAKANETDPDKIVFGPQMVQKVKELSARLDEVLARCVEWRTEVKVRWKVEEEARKGADTERQAQVKQQVEEQQRVKEQERQARDEDARLLAEKARREEEERQRKRKEAEERERQEQEQERRETEEKARRKEAERRLEEEARLRKEAEDRAQTQAAETMNLDGALRMLREGFRATSESQRRLREVLKVLHTFMTYIVAEPSDPKFRKIRRDNPDVQRDILQHQGGLECLYALGFREKRVPGSTDRKDGEVLYVMEEPSMTDIDVWLAWFDELKKKEEAIKEDIDRIRLL